MLTLLTVLANIPSIFVNMLELPESLDNVYVLARPRHDELGAFVKAVVENLQRLEDMSPVFALVIQSLVENVHDLVKRGVTSGISESTSLNNAPVVDSGGYILCKGHLGNLGHVGPNGTPWVIAGSCANQEPIQVILETKLLTIANLDLRRGVPLRHILDASHDFRHCGCGRDRRGEVGGAGWGRGHK
jgi:hypothetical protein